MSEEQPEEQMDSEAEDSSVGNQTEQPIESSSQDESVGDAAEPQLGFEPDDSLAGEVGAQQLGSETADSPDEEPKAPTPKDSRAGGFLKRALRWIVTFLVVFTLGIVAMQFVRVGPLTDERDSLSQS